MEEEKKGRQSFEGFHVTEDPDVERALEEYQAADARLFELAQRYLYPPEEVPYVGQRQLVFPTVAARDEYQEVRRLAQESQLAYERIARERQNREQTDPR